MKVRLISPNQLTPELIDQWRRVQASDSAFDNPFFTPEFIQAAARVFPEVSVAVIYFRGELVGFFPFERLNDDQAIPAGRALSDSHGIMALPSFHRDATEILSACNLRSWRFQLWPRSAAVAPPTSSIEHDVHFINLESGFDAYEDFLKQNGGDFIKRTRQKLRKLEREVGPVSVQLHSSELHALDQIFAWKQERFREQGRRNLLDADKLPDLLRTLATEPTQELSCMLTTLHAGNHFIAGHFGMLSHGVLNAWVLGHDNQFSKYSPGMLLWLRLLESSNEMGVRRIELGPGDQRFKTELRTGTRKVCEGILDNRGFRRAMKVGWLRTRNWVNNSRLKKPAQHLVRSLRQWFR